jgi:AraC family transcriptional activator of pyochelin receptor
MKKGKTKSYDLPFIRQAREILDADPRRQLTITALALEVGINSFKLRMGFKEVYNITIHQYRLDLRLNLAKKLLDETDLTIAEIAYKTGFDSRDGFARSFRKKFAQCPREWRKIQDISVDESKEIKIPFGLSFLSLN